jgi:hypothetical protein
LGIGGRGADASPLERLYDSGATSRLHENRIPYISWLGTWQDPRQRKTGQPGQRLAQPASVADSHLVDLPQAFQLQGR